MLNRIIPLLIIAGTLFGITYPVFAQKSDEAEIRATLTQRDKEVKAILGTKGKLTPAQKAKLKPLINGVISFEEMGKATLGKHWQTLTATQQTEFIDVFSQIVQEQSLADLDPFRARVTYKSVTVNGNEAKVKTTAVWKKIKTQVDYDLKKIAGTWYITNFYLDNVGTVEGYARSFQTMIRKRGFDTLMKRLNRRLEKMKQ